MTRNAEVKIGLRLQFIRHISAMILHHTTLHLKVLQLTVPAAQILNRTHVLKIRTQQHTSNPEYQGFRKWWAQTSCRTEQMLPKILGEQPNDEPAINQVKCLNSWKSQRNWSTFATGPQNHYVIVTHLCIHYLRFGSLWKTENSSCHRQRIENLTAVNLTGIILQ